MGVLAEGLRVDSGGRYTLEHELGRGGMAVVYLALKMLHPQLFATLPGEGPA